MRGSPKYNYENHQSIQTHRRCPRFHRSERWRSVATRRIESRPHGAAGAAAEVPGQIGVSLKDSTSEWPEPLKAPKGAPNVLLIMGDDIGYAHMSSFGGPANTPTFDRLAKQGLRFINFHTTAVCSASRAALITGRNAHSVGMGSTPEGALPYPGYHAHIQRNAATVLETLRLNGYGTAWIGKTHLTPMNEITAAGPFDRWPGGMGAEYFYGFFGPGVSQWYPPLWENTTPIKAPKTPAEGYHLEADMADQTIAFIQRQKSMHPDKPWIAYYAPNGHKPPIGVPEEFIKKYKGKFDDGYDKLRETHSGAAEGTGDRPGQHKARAHARGHTAVGHAQRHGQKGRRPLDGSLHRGS